MPIAVTTLRIVPAPGRFAEGIAATLANAGMAIPAAAMRSVSAAVDTDRGSKPLVSA